MKANKKASLDNVTQVDWARLAAYIDGEGTINICITTNRRKVSEQQKGKHRIEHLQVNVVNTDPRLVMWCFQTFGGCVHGKPRIGRNHKPCYYWAVCSGTAKEILQRCMPYFLIKQEQAQIALAYQATRLPRGGHGLRITQGVLDLRDHYAAELKRIRREVRPSPLHQLDEAVTH